MIDTGQKFLDAVRTTGAKSAASDDDAVAALDGIFRDHASYARNLPLPHQERYLFWSGAVIGLKVALRGYANRLRLAAEEQKGTLE